MILSSRAQAFKLGWNVGYSAQPGPRRVRENATAVCSGLTRDQGCVVPGRRGSPGADRTGCPGCFLSEGAGIPRVVHDAGLTPDLALGTLAVVEVGRRRGVILNMTLYNMVSASLMAQVRKAAGRGIG